MFTWRIYHLLIVIWFSAVVLALVVTAIRVENDIFRAWNLGLLAVALPWAAMRIVRFLLPPAPIRTWLTQILLWSPVGLLFVLINFQKVLCLDPEFGVTPVACVWILLVPGLCLFSTRTARSRPTSEGQRSNRSDKRPSKP